MPARPDVPKAGIGFPSVEEQWPLVQKLDPKRDYGDRSLADIIRAVEAGTLWLYPGQTGQPVIRDADGFVKGSGRFPASGRFERSSRAMTQKRFLELAEDDIDFAYEKLKEAITVGARKGQTDGIRLWLSYAIGHAPRSLDDAEDDMAKSLLNLIQGEGQEAAVYRDDEKNVVDAE